MFKFKEAALKSNAWPFKEANALYKKLNGNLPKKGYVLFETGYGPSGLPHIGTFAEVVRTSMVRYAFEQISGMPTRLFCISDDVDGMRKIPDTIPNKDEYIQHLDFPLTSIPDPFGTHDSFGAHMNNRLKNFLDSFGFEYEFKSATDCYKNGEFNEYLLRVLDKYEAIMDIMLPTLGEERRKTYSPFLPISPTSGKVLQVPILNINKSSGSITFEDEDGIEVTQEVTSGKCKLQWKPDFGMRWAAFDVDFEMYGKDHLANGPIYTKICNTIGGKAPLQMVYELFLDKGGQKISKSKGNGISVEEWLRYGTEDSLSLFMYQHPTRAKRLYFEVIPKSVDECIAFKKKFLDTAEDDEKYYSNPFYHIARGNWDGDISQISYSLLLNLVSACNTDDITVLKKYIKQFDSDANFEDGSMLSNMLTRAINYYEDFIKPQKKYRKPLGKEINALQTLSAKLIELEVKFSSTDAEISTDELQTLVFSVGKEFEFDLKAWFITLYETLLGSHQGPRFGVFIKLFGIKNTIQLIRDAVDGKLVNVKLS